MDLCNRYFLTHRQPVAPLYSMLEFVLPLALELAL
jgi:hypothetical protein